ncbi:phosphomannomutase [Geothermobacter ehrlichii]|uniref:Phosphomannomutase n=1 Tax=Geothermobacter ehrlichii TaxID=213224 RepID=A0A5D3WHV5_9BACT|nr:phosphomannomutase [Geothermobacter ehrlichii]TYO96305.1 phosphomannomutase [Geothermobacter ehrlichii]
MKLTCFKAYDIRGRLPDELNEDLAWRIGRAYAAWLRPKRVVVGRDVRLSSEALAAALMRGLTEGGSDVVDIGLCGTEEVYFVTDYGRFDGGIMVTASHNPIDFNGMKLVRQQARPISGDSGLDTIRQLVAGGEFPPADQVGQIERENFRGPYVRHLLGYLCSTELRPLKVVVNPGNGCAGPVVRLLEAQLPFEFIPVHFDPDGRFPNGIPNPLLPENRSATAEAVRRHGADFGVAWDGDFDRCFLFDEKGEFIEGYYIVGLLAEFLLGVVPGAKIIHDPRLTWNTIDIVRRAGGTPIMSKTGHAFIKERMRAEDALYGGEMSAHHYFRDFAYCDSGMIPWLLVAGLMCRTGKPLSALVAERIAAYPASGEINRRVADPEKVLRLVEEEYAGRGGRVDHTDGLSVEFDDWRFNLRPSNTEPVLRLNVESRGDRALMQRCTEELLARIDAID